MHALRHVMFTPVERVLAHFLGLLVVTILGRDLLPHLVLLLPSLVLYFSCSASSCYH